MFNWETVRKPSDTWIPPIQMTSKTIYMAGNYDYGATVHEKFCNGEDCEATGNYAHAEGLKTKASGNYSHSEGVSALASHDYSYVFNGDKFEMYESKGDGTFCINTPYDETLGLSGVYIRDRNLAEIFDAYGGGKTILTSNNDWTGTNQYLSSSTFKSSVQLYGTTEVMNGMQVTQIDPTKPVELKFEKGVTYVATVSEETSSNIAASTAFVKSNLATMARSVNNDITDVKTNYLPLTGGTLTGPITVKNIVGVSNVVCIKTDSVGKNSLQVSSDPNGVSSQLRLVANDNGTSKHLVRSVNGSAAGADGDVALETEVWTFVFADGTSEDRTVVVK